MVGRLFVPYGIEDQHREHVWDELRACYESRKFNEASFIETGVRMLDGVKMFWDGLDEARLRTESVVAVS